MTHRVRWTIFWVLLVALLWSRQRYEPLSYYSSRSYVQRANDLIRKEGLVYDCRDDTVKLTDRATAAEQQWVEASYLRDDIDLYNGNRELFGHFFVVEDCKLRELNPFLRTIRLPFAKSLDWMGNIEYSGPGAEATLRSSNGRLIHLQRSLPNAPQSEVRTPVGNRSDVAANVVHLDFGGAATPGVELHSAAGTAVLEQRVKRGQPADVRLLGNSVSEGRIAKLASGDWLHLANASRSETFLYTAERRYERLSTVRTRNAEQARTYDEAEPLLRWIGGEDGEQMLTFAEALSRSVTNALQQLDPSRAAELSEQFDIQLSVDRALQSSLDQSLSAYASNLVRDAAGGQPFAASVTVMNGKSGEILAAASFPSQVELENAQGVAEDERRRLLVNHNFKRHPIGSAGKPFFYASIASRHPFLLDMTVAPHGPAKRPDGGEGEREVLQFFFPHDYLLWPHYDARIGLESAIERSCNKFTVELATLALAAARDLRDRTLNRPLSEVFARQPDVTWTPSANDAVQIAGQTLDFPPSLGMHMLADVKPVPPRAQPSSAAIQPGSLNRVYEAPFVEVFEELTGVRTYGGLAAPDVPADENTTVGRGAMVTMQYDLRPWRQLVERFTQGEDADKAWKLRAAFQSVSPERVNLSLNQVNQFREEFVSLVLGGATSMWTNVQLAEAMSRLVTKRQVEATMIHTLRDRTAKTPPPEPQPAQFAELGGVSEEARAAVLRGMSRVILPPHGTARAFGLEGWLARLRAEHPGYNIALFSKTGSPTVTRRQAKPVGRILEELVIGGNLFLHSGFIAVSSNRRTIVPYAAPNTRGRAAYVATLERATRAAAVRARQPYTARTLHRITAYADRFARYRGRPRSEEVSLPFAASPGGVLGLNREHPVFDPIAETDSAAVYILSLVKWKGTADVPTAAELAAPDARVITAAFYFDIGPGSTVAVEGARAMLPRIAKLLE